jgi:hypothetical protein
MPKLYLACYHGRTSAQNQTHQTRTRRLTMPISRQVQYVLDQKDPKNKPKGAPIGPMKLGLMGTFGMFGRPKSEGGNGRVPDPADHGPIDFRQLDKKDDNEASDSDDEQ